MKRMILVLLSIFVFSINAFAAVNLNTASQAELETLKGVGPAKAAAILEYRKKNGGFKSVDDLNKVTGFGDKSVASLKSQVTVGGAAAATPNDAMAKARAAKAEKAAATKAAAEKK